jgi:hypothetical protein
MPDHIWGNQAPTRSADADVAEDRCRELEGMIARLELRCRELESQRDIARRTLDEAGGRWIPIEQAMPEPPVDESMIEVLIWTGLDQYLAAYWPRSNRWEIEVWDTATYEVPREQITHWRPLPEPPEVSDE